MNDDAGYFPNTLIGLIQGFNPFMDDKTLNYINIAEVDAEEYDHHFFPYSNLLVKIKYTI